MGHLKKINDMKHFSLPANIKTCVISDVTTATKTLELGSDLVFDIEGDEQSLSQYSVGL